LLVPQNVNLSEGIITKKFIESHIAYIDRNNPTHFATINGVLGLFIYHKRENEDEELDVCRLLAYFKT
jgi:hypothetical protein